MFCKKKKRRKERSRSTKLKSNVNKRLVDCLFSYGPNLNKQNIYKYPRRRRRYVQRMRRERGIELMMEANKLLSVRRKYTIVSVAC